LQLSYKSYADKVLKVLKDNKREFCEKVGVLAVAEAQSLTPVLTGNLKKSIVSEVMDKNAGVYIGVTPEAPYGVMVEKGTSKQMAQPYLEPGVINAIPKISKVAEQIYRDKLGGN
jgi:HK97 gp10 family phage protein